MRRAHRLSISTLVLVITVPLTWLACGGSAPPKTPADENAAAAGSAEPAASDSASPAETASAAPAAEAPAPAKEAAAPAPPPAPPLGGTDCGRCIDKTCSKQQTACGKNNDCQSTLEAFHSCSSSKGAAACVDSATPPSAAKPKKLATAYETCAKKALAKTCKAKCQ